MVAALASAPISKQNVGKHISTAVWPAPPSELEFWLTTQLVVLVLVVVVTVAFLDFVFFCCLTFALLFYYAVTRGCTYVLYICECMRIVVHIYINKYS